MTLSKEAEKRRTVKSKFHYSESQKNSTDASSKLSLKQPRLQFKVMVSSKETKRRSWCIQPTTTEEFVNRVSNNRRENVVWWPPEDFVGNSLEISFEPMKKHQHSNQCCVTTEAAMLEAGHEWTCPGSFIKTRPLCCKDNLLLKTICRLNTDAHDRRKWKSMVEREDVRCCQSSDKLLTLSICIFNAK